MVQTLKRRAQIVCDSEDSLNDEIEYLNTIFIKNNYNTDFIERNTYIRPNDMFAPCKVIQNPESR